MPTPLVTGNWKMNGSTESVDALLDALLPGVQTLQSCEVAVCSPSIYLPQVAAKLQGSNISWGAQTVSEFESGAYTGEIAASMLSDLKCRYVIVGHSERRHVFGESDAAIAAKFAQAQKHGLIPIFCVGETLEQREAGETDSLIMTQLNAVLDAHGVGALVKSVIAYEPVWAIGTGKTASPEQAQQVHALIRQAIAKHDEAIAEKVQILYGGSVKPDNAAMLFSQPDINGGLIGGASLQAEDFIAICRAAEA